MKKAISLILALVLALALCACSAGALRPSAPATDISEAPDGVTVDDPDAEPAPTLPYSGEVVLYSSMQEDQLQAVKEGFEAAYPGITMTYQFGSTSAIEKQIFSEADAGQVNADVIWVGDAVDYVAIKQRGILQKYSSPEAAGLDPAYVDADGYYTAARLVGVGIAYNTLTVPAKDAPKSWEDLLDPRWAGQIVMSDPGAAGTTKYWMNAMMCSDQYGAGYMQQLRDNGCVLESGTTATHHQLASQVYQVGICVDYVTAGLAADGSPVAFLYPENTVTVASPIGLVANCANVDNAKLLYDFILSKEGQEILVAHNLVSVRRDVEQSVDLSSIPSYLSCDFARLAAEGDANLAEFNRIFGLD